MKYCLALISILLGSVAQYFLKVGMSSLPQDSTILEKVIYIFSSANVWIGLICYGASMIFWLYVLSIMELSKAYPLVSLGYVFTLIIGYYILNESVNTWRIVGIIAIMIGVILIMKS